MVYCTDDAPSVYATAYGWWCRDCPEIRDPETDPTTKANAERQADRHARRAIRTAPLTERLTA
jgi:hypothetical protein